MPIYKNKLIRPDIKGQISIGQLTSCVSSFIIAKTVLKDIIPEPQVAIPASENWLVENIIALNRINNNLINAAAEKIRTKGNFAKKHGQKR